ncbi:MAG TPA: hypothetical protein VHL51_10855 [Gaiellales bacterium]|nr:hypothetical protein [Gaiellales bacterium]
MNARVPTTTMLAMLVAVALGATACGGGDAGQPKASAAVTRCPAASVAGWKQVSRRAGIPVYCPAWLPSPLQPAIDMSGTPGAENATVAFSRDGSYLVSWIWAEAQTGEVHVILRGYPGRTAIPTCVLTGSGSSASTRHHVPCFADPHGTITVGGIHATLYTVNQGADQWHLLYAWRNGGSLYTISQHVAAPLGVRQVHADLRRMLQNLVTVDAAS